VPPKLDPYATPRARAVDLALIIFTLLLIALAIWTAPRHRSDTGAVSPAKGANASVLLVSATRH
jgi:hypothetical protein